MKGIPGLIKTAVPFSIRFLLGGIFIYAGAEKIYYPADFARIVYNYHILPDAMINLTALLLPWMELILGICLIFGFWLPGAVLMANGLLWTFFLALLFNHYRGLDVHCGCFSTQADPTGYPQTVHYLFRETILVIAAGYLLFRQLMDSKARSSPSNA